MKTKHFLISSILALVCSAPCARASQLLMNFEDATGVDSVAGVDATAYLSAHGITLSNTTGPVTIFSDLYLTYEGASSPHNFLLQNTSGAPNGISYTLNFSSPLQDIGFTRIAQVTPNLVAQWTATAYSGANVVGSVGESMFGGTEAAQTYLITGTNITSLTITANGGGVAGVPSAPLDDFVTTVAVPEPTGAALLGAGTLLLVARRRRSPRK